MKATSVAEAAPALRRILGDRFTTAESVRVHHGRDESPLPPATPDAVAFPASEEEVAAVLAECSRRRVPVVPFGAGTSLEGHVLATSGGISLDLSGLNRILDIGIDDLDARVEAGVTRKQLEERLRHEGLFFPVDPGADATIGGMAATGASGTTTVRYGAMRDNVLSLRVALPSGQIVDTGGRARKSSAGYDLTRLFVGSEGTLGVITEVRLRLFGLPSAISAAVASFARLEEAVRAVITTLQTGIPVARIELLDEAAMKAVAAYSGLEYPIAPTLFFEFHGAEAAVEEAAADVEEIVRETDLLAFTSTRDEAERVRLWRARHDHFYASLALRPGARAITTDVCVPISRLAECIAATSEDVARSGLVSTTAGHVGDGNFHVMLLVDPGDPAEMRNAEDVGARLVDRALGMGGTCTGEHGIGLHKIGFLEQEMGTAVEVMRVLKDALDPAGIMNPGKVFLAR